MSAVGTTAVVGAGPIGLVLARALAETGEQVLLIDPDQGPAADGTWRRTGVMQFQHPHFFRHHVRDALEQHVQGMWQAVVAAGAVVNEPPPGAPEAMTTVACRRSVLEAALRRAAVHDGLTFLAGRAEDVVVDDDRVVGVVVDGEVHAVHRVVAAHGRRGDLGEVWRPPQEGGPCGLSYVSRMYRARPGVAPLRSWVPIGAQYDGYEAIAFPQDDGTISALIVRPSDDDRLEALWQEAAYETAVALIPNLAPWTDPTRFDAITPVMRGGTLTNHYRGQGEPPTGLFFVGDAVCTTNPAAGRGVTLGLWQVSALLRLLHEEGDDRAASCAFDAWCEEHIRPWYDDQARDDAWALTRYRGAPLDLSDPLPSDVVLAATSERPDLLPVVQDYLTMLAPPSSLRPLHDEVRALLATGWHPPCSDGPSTDELVEAMGRARQSATAT